MDTYIGSKTEYDNKLSQAEYAFDRQDWRTALGYFQACFYYAQKKRMNTSYLEMKIRDCEEELGLK